MEFLKGRPSRATENTENKLQITTAVFHFDNASLPLAA